MGRGKLHVDPSAPRAVAREMKSQPWRTSNTLGIRGWGEVNKGYCKGSK